MGLPAHSQAVSEVCVSHSEKYDCPWIKIRIGTSGSGFPVISGLGRDDSHPSHDDNTVYLPLCRGQLCVKYTWVVSLIGWAGREALLLSVPKLLRCLKPTSKVHGDSRALMVPWAPGIEPGHVHHGQTHTRASHLSRQLPSVPSPGLPSQKWEWETWLGMTFISSEPSSSSSPFPP